MKKIWLFLTLLVFVGLVLAGCGAFTGEAIKTKTSSFKTVYTCIGTVPGNAALCMGDSSGLGIGTPRTLVASCSPSVKCEYTCNSGFSLSGGYCVPTPADCGGNDPIHRCITNGANPPAVLFSGNQACLEVGGACTSVEFSCHNIIGGAPRWVAATNACYDTSFKSSCAYRAVCGCNTMGSCPRIPFIPIEINGNAYFPYDPVAIPYRAYQVPRDSFRIVCQEPCDIPEELIFSAYAGFKAAKESLINLMGIDVLPELTPVDIHLNEDSWCPGPYNSGGAGLYYSNKAYMCLYLVEKSAEFERVAPESNPYTVENINKVESQTLFVHEYAHTTLFSRYRGDSEDLAQISTAFVTGWGGPRATDMCNGLYFNYPNHGKLFYELCTRYGFNFIDLKPVLIELVALNDRGIRDIPTEPGINKYQLRKIIDDRVHEDTFNVYLANLNAVFEVVPSGMSAWDFQSQYWAGLVSIGDRKSISREGGTYSLLDNRFSITFRPSSTRESFLLEIDNPNSGSYPTGVIPTEKFLLFRLGPSETDFDTAADLSIEMDVLKNFDSIRLFRGRDDYSDAGEEISCTSCTYDPINGIISAQIDRTGTYILNMVE